jgi:UDP:flavonoid glycosyltransferase YjiC (YdhE family)
VPIPHVSDQFAWSEELARLGVAPRAIRRTRLNATILADRIRQVLDDAEMKRRALAMRDRMKDDDGPSTAADLIEKIRV